MSRDARTGTDAPLKVLFKSYPQDLLSLTGDAGAAVRRAASVELQALHRRVDCVLELEKDGEIYYRHLEFQAKPDAGMAARCFRYNTQLVLQYEAPVVTTVLYLFPPRPKDEPVFRVLLGGREVNRWRFEEIYLWELDAAPILAGGPPGLVALVPLMRGGRNPQVLEAAVERIEQAFPQGTFSQAEDVLLALASRYYTVSELMRMVGRTRMMQSSLYQEGLADGRSEGRTEGRTEGRIEGRAEGRTEGRTEGRLEVERELCAALAFKHHPAVFGRARPIIESCQDPDRLREAALRASDLTDGEFLRLLDG